MFLRPERQTGLLLPLQGSGWGSCSVYVGWALSREDGRAGGLQVQGEVSEEGIREEVKS